MLVPLSSPVYAHFWFKHKDMVLSDLGLPPDLKYGDLELFVESAEINKTKDG